MPNAPSPPRNPDTDLRKPVAEGRKPKTGKSSTALDIKSFVRKILLASPMFPRLYADVIIAYRPNSFEAKILAQSYEKIVAYTERTKLMSNLKSCTHIKVSGVRCGSPPLRGEQFCYFHQRMLRTVKDPASRIHHHALLEDEESIQASLMEVVNALLRGTIELKRAELILRALNTAVRNIRRVNFGLHSDEMVREIPNYPTPPLEQVDEQYAAELRRHEAYAAAARVPKEDPLIEYFGGADKIPAHLRKPTPSSASPATASPTLLPAHLGPNASTSNVRTTGAGTTNVGTAAPGCPGGPEVPGRSAPPPKPVQAEAAEAATRKPPLGVKEAPKERKSAARGASRA